MAVSDLLYQIHHLRIFHNAPYLPPKILHNLCFSFLLGTTAVPREIENNAYAKFGGANKWEMCKRRVQKYCGYSYQGDRVHIE